MKTFFFLFISLLNFSHAGTQSVLLTRVLEAIRIQAEQPELKSRGLLRKDFDLILKLLDKHQVASPTLSRWHTLNPADHKLQSLPLPTLSKSGEAYPALSLHAHKFYVAEESDDVTNDDLYVSFFITDGNIPTGKLSSIYRGIDEGESFLFILQDRILYPLDGSLQIPRGHLIIDYMIIESDGDDIKEMKRISGFITELAIEFYKRKYGEPGELTRIREEVRALSEALLDLNHDDRLVTATWAPSPLEVNQSLEGRSFAEITRTHKESSTWGDFKYKITFRLIR